MTRADRDDILRAWLALDEPIPRVGEAASYLRDALERHGCPLGGGEDDLVAWAEHGTVPKEWEP